MTIRLKLFTGFAILILIFIVDFFVNQRFSREVIRNTNYINNSEIVIRNSSLLHKLMIDMQSGYRGYLLTSQKSFLDTYYNGINSIQPLIKVQHDLVSAGIQKDRLDSILTLHNRWVRYANALISVKEDTSAEAARTYNTLFEKKLRREVGKRLNDEIRTIFQEFDNYEYAVRRERRAVLERSIERTRQISLSLTLFSISLALLSSYYIIRIITGRISKMVAMADDIAKGNFRVMNDDHKDELKQLSESLNAMSRKLSQNFRELTQKNKELDQFAYVVSHDLKAPLRGIDNIIAWIEEDHGNDLVPGVSKNIELVKGRTRRLENMINGLLDYARIGKTRKSSEPVNVDVMLRELIDLLVPADFIVSIGKGMPMLVTEKMQLEQVFSNLISNAVKYNNKATGNIVITSKETDSSYEFTVKDNGIGIQAEYFDKIFTIFQTLQERDAFESTGVGLAIVKKIIEDQKASITVESEPGEWTLFRFTWPKVQEEEV
jgi:signal transduction histidine kinase